MVALDEIIKLYVFPTGRRLLAHRTVRDVAAGLDLPAIVTHVDDAIRHDRGTSALELQWEERKAARRERKPVRGDRRVDALLGSLYGVARSYARLDDLPQAQAARAVLELFPTGLKPLVQQVHEEQHATVAWMLTVLEGDLAPAIHTLGLHETVVQLKHAHAGVEAALISPPPLPGAAWPEVRKAQAEGQRRLLQTFALCIAAFPWDSPEDTEKRSHLLRPILEQNEEIGRARKKHGRARASAEPIED